MELLAGIHQNTIITINIISQSHQLESGLRPIVGSCDREQTNCEANRKTKLWGPQLERRASNHQKTLISNIQPGTHTSLFISYVMKSAAAF